MRFWRHKFVNPKLVSVQLLHGQMNLDLRSPCSLSSEPHLLFSTLLLFSPSMLHHWTWIPQSKLTFDQHHRVSQLASGLCPFAHHNPNSPQLRLPLADTIACRNGEYFLIKTHTLCLIVRPYAGSSELSYTTTLIIFLHILRDQHFKKKITCFCQLNFSFVEKSSSVENNSSGRLENNSSVGNNSGGTSKHIVRT